jgi:hypothetical protein
MQARETGTDGPKFPEKSQKYAGFGRSLPVKLVSFRTEAFHTRGRLEPIEVVQEDINWLSIAVNLLQQWQRRPIPARRQ